LGAVHLAAPSKPAELTVLEVETLGVKRRTDRVKPDRPVLHLAKRR
jgi:hypothetical protein